jgi:predicted nucleotidyltransferase
LQAVQIKKRFCDRPVYNRCMDSIAAYFKSDPHIIAVYLFGSRAKNKARANSDWDLAVLLKSEVSEAAYLSLRLSWMAGLEKYIKEDVDIVILNEAGAVLRHQVLSTGKLIWVADPKALVRFKARTWIDYMDWQPYQARLDRSVMNFFRKTA